MIDTLRVSLKNSRFLANDSEFTAANLSRSATDDFFFLCLANDALIE